MKPALKDDCSVPKAKGVLVLSNTEPSNVPFVISFDGTVDADINFEYGQNTQALYSCGATLNDEFWVFGGRDFKRQVYTI